MTRVLAAAPTGYLGGFVAKEFRNRGSFLRALAFQAESEEKELRSC